MAKRTKTKQVGTSSRTVQDDGRSPAELLAALDRPDAKEWLAEQIDEAKARVAEAQAELKSLMTLERIRAIRAGELKRRAPTKRKTKANTPTTLADRIIALLRDRGPSTTAMLGVALSADDQQIASELLRLEKARLVRRADVDGRPGWEAS